MERMFANEQTVSTSPATERLLVNAYGRHNMYFRVLSVYLIVIIA
jgi:hypothetical protein